jgi:uncharacterized protein YkwD
MPIEPGAAGPDALPYRRPRGRTKSVVLTTTLLLLGAAGIAAPALRAEEAAPLPPPTALGEAAEFAPPAGSPFNRVVVPPPPAPSPVEVPAPAASPSAYAEPPAARLPRRPERPPATPGEGARAKPRSAADVALEKKVAELVNQRRAAAGCAALRSDSRLAAASLRHSSDMAAQNYFSHTGRNGSTPWDRAKAAGYQQPTGENLAAGQRTAEEVVKAWMDSAGHRANIVNCDSKAMGVGMARGGSYGIYWTQMFGAV